jgi:hypothetical protein
MMWCARNSHALSAYRLPSGEPRFASTASRVITLSMTRSRIKKCRTSSTRVGSAFQCSAVTRERNAGFADATAQDVAQVMRAGDVQCHHVIGERRLQSRRQNRDIPSQIAHECSRSARDAHT